MGRESQLAIACCDLVADVTHASGAVQLRVAGSSMVPGFWPDDLVQVSTCDFATLLPGEIIVFRQHGGLVMHRILRHNGATVTARGDARRRPDAPVLPGHCIGKVDRVLRRGKPVNLRLSRAQACIAWLLRRSELVTHLYLRCCSILRRLFDRAPLREGAPSDMGMAPEIPSELRIQG